MHPLLLVATALVATTFPPGRIAKARALRRVAHHACATTLPHDVRPDALAACMRGFAHDVIWDQPEACAEHGVLLSKLPFCQAAAAAWMQAQRDQDVGASFVALIKAHGRCSGATLCPPDVVKEAAIRDPSPQSAHN